MLRIAFASADRIRVDEHFGMTRGLVIYDLDDKRAQCVAVVEFPIKDSGHHDEGRLAARIAALDGCTAVYCAAIGGSAIRQLLARGIQPIRLKAPEPIETILAELRTSIRLGGVPWIETALGKHTSDPDRFARMIAEGWEG
ncbi:NifB/NifX family molybdenum-iron cluster-binding protein [Thermochromatium tepidum]|uniref:NifB/NifX family molybdenum-iron cluster-binding protein n=1 Tax=Thermochromatium tepidum TaxID=1050 RepID=UPI002483C561|nr:NifB/NifX family molybdenum-iron cluster-binding protein [Thermochromatium tepidum]